MKQLILFLRYYEKAFIFGITTVMLITFFAAYFNGGQVLVTINEYGEANIEFIWIIISLGVMVFNYLTRNLFNP